MTIATTRTLRNVIDGERVDSLGDRTDPVINPATEEVLAEAPRGTAADVERAVAAARRAARELEFGCVWINTHLPFLSEMPHGGFGQSGYGKDLSVYALEEYTRLKHVTVSLA
jgi:acyl-CoA reductase-like NAD-dependent aldehyde dehydrogenase